MRTLLFTSLAATAAASTITCTVERSSNVSCPVTCIPAHQRLIIKGSCASAVNTASYNLSLSASGLPLIDVKGVDGCPPTDFPIGGALDIGHFYFGVVGCPLDGKFAVSSQLVVATHAPKDTLTGVLRMEDQAGAAMFVIEMVVNI